MSGAIPCCSGLFASVVSVPADVVKTRMMSQVGVLREVVWVGGIEWVPFSPAHAPASQPSSIRLVIRLARPSSSPNAHPFGPLPPHNSPPSLPPSTPPFPPPPAPRQDPAAPKYRSSLDCLVRSVRAEGLLALYKGFLPTWARLGPWQLVFWTSYEGTRAAFNLGGF